MRNYVLFFIFAGIFCLTLYLLDPSLWDLESTFGPFTDTTLRFWMVFSPGVASVWLFGFLLKRKKIAQNSLWGYAMSIFIGFVLALTIGSISHYTVENWQFWAAFLPTIIAGIAYALSPKKLAL